MRRALFWSLAVALSISLVVLARLAADDPANGQSDASPSERLQAITDEYNTAQQEFSQEYRKAETDEERQQILNELYPDAEEYAAKMLDLAREIAEDPVAVDALVWVISNARGGSGVGEALEILGEHHSDSPQLAQVAIRLIYARSPAVEPFLIRLLEESPHEKVRGNACFALAKYCSQRADLVRAVETRPELSAYVANYYGEEFAQRIEDEGLAKLEEEVEALFERVVDEFGDLAYQGNRTLGDLAERDLFEIRYLAIGKVAPEIEGEDIDGVPFKLSDYRGKVVVLDFWGNW